MSRWNAELFLDALTARPELAQRLARVPRSTAGWASLAVELGYQLDGGELMAVMATRAGRGLSETESVDEFLAALSRQAQSGGTAPELADVKSAAVFMMSGLGDQLIAWPTLRALDHLMPGRMRLLLGHGLYDLYRDVAQGPPLRVRWRDFAQRQLETPEGLGTADLFVSLAAWSAPSVVELGRAMQARRTMGLFPGFDVQVPYEPERNMFDILFAVPQHLDPGLRLEDFAGPPRLSPAAQRAAAAVIDAHVPRGHRILFVHPETRPEKTWPTERYRAVLRALVEADPDLTVIVATRTDFALGRVVSLDLHFELALAVLGRSDAFLGIDSCFLHAADLFRLPSVGLFGPTSPHHWGFRLTPTGSHVWGEGSMERVREGAVWEAVHATLRNIAPADR